jgi:hypothetical protein
MKQRLLAIVSHRRTAPVALGLYVASVIAVVGAYMAVSNKDVRQSALFQTSELLESGRASALRGGFLDAQTGQFQPVRDVRFELLEPESGQRYVVGDGVVGRTGLIHTFVRPPEGLKAGSYRFRVSATYPDGVQFSADGPIVVSSTDAGHREALGWPRPSLREDPSEHPRPVVEPLAGQDGKKDQDRETPDEEARRFDLSIYPGDGELIRGLGNVVYLRTTDRETGRPLPARVRLDEVKGIVDGELPREVVTNRLGLARIEWTPITDGHWKVSVAERQRSAPSEDHGDDGEGWMVRWRTVPAQFSITLAEPVARPGERARGRVESLYQSGGFFVDLYDGWRWLDSAAYGLGSEGGGFEVDVPPVVPGIDAFDAARQPLLYRVQVYQSLYVPSRAWDVAYMVRVEERSTAGYRDAAYGLMSFLADHLDDPYYGAMRESGLLEMASSSELVEALDAWTRVIPRQFEAPREVVNTQQAARDALEQWKAEVKKDLMALTALIFLAGLVVLGYFVTLGVMRHRREAALIAAVDLEVDDDDEDAYLRGQRAASLERVLVVLQGGMALLTIVAFALGILMLLSYL